VLLDDVAEVRLSLYKPALPASHFWFIPPLSNLAPSATLPPFVVYPISPLDEGEKIATMPQASLLQDVLRQQLEAVEDAQRRSAATATSPTSSTSDLPSPLSPPRHIAALLSPPDSDDDEPIDVVSPTSLSLPSGLLMNLAPFVLFVSMTFHLLPLVDMYRCLVQRLRYDPCPSPAPHRRPEPITGHTSPVLWLNMH
jgi:hypothetical protein